MPDDTTPRATGALPPDTSHPPLPTEAQVRAADIEDEAADPVVDSGPGIDDDGEDGKPRFPRQPA